jgi:hypothetical protein
MSTHTRKNESFSSSNRKKRSHGIRIIYSRTQLERLTKTHTHYERPLGSTAPLAVNFTGSDGTSVITRI